MASARLVALKAQIKVNCSEAYSNIVLDSEIRRSGLNKRDVALVAAIFYGVLERKILLDYAISRYSKIKLEKIDCEVLEILRMGFYQLMYMDKIPKSAAVNEGVSLCRAIGKASASGFVNGVLRAFVRSNMDFTLPDKVKNFTSYLSIKYSCPEDIVNMWRGSYGRDCTVDLLKSLAFRPPLNIRINTLKTTKCELKINLLSKGIEVREVPFFHDALELCETGSVEELAGFAEGMFHVQDLASQLCCEVLGARAGEIVMDVCAAPGGKVFTTAQIMENRGRIFAFDLHENKLRLIKQGLSRLSLSIVETSMRDAREPWNSGFLANKVLCDVPCSGLGIIRRKPEIRYKGIERFARLPEIQYNILSNCSQCVKPGGLLVYSTCTLNPQENNIIADRFLRESDGYQAVDLSPICNRFSIKRNNFEPGNQLTMFPHVHGTDGFFIAAFRRG